MAHTKIYCTFYAILFYLWQLTYTFIAFKCHWNVIVEEKSSQGYKITLNTKILQKILNYLLCSKVKLELENVATIFILNKNKNIFSL